MDDLAPGNHYSPSGRGHRVLAKLAERAFTVAQLRYEVDSHASANQRRKLFYVLSSLSLDGLIRRFGEHYEITLKGREVLAGLNLVADPFQPVITSVRVFKREGVAA